MADYYCKPLMHVWGSRPQELKSEQSEHSLAAFLLSYFCHEIVGGRLTVATDLNGQDLDDFVWQIECLYLALVRQFPEHSE